MKRLLDAVARRLGYMPITEAAQVLEEVEWSAARERASRREAERRYAGTTSAAARELAAVTARIPLP